MQGRSVTRMVPIVVAWMLLVTALAVAQQPVVIQMMEFNRAEEAAWQRAVIEEFHKDQSGIRVELVHPGAEAVSKAISMLAAGIPPHIAYGDPEHTVFWGRQGIAMDLTPFMERDWDSSPFEEYHPVTLDLHAIGDQRYGVPLDLQVQAFFYSQVHFDEAGLTYPDETWTWDTVANTAPLLTVDRDGDGNPERWGMRDPGYLDWWSLLWHFGGEFVDDPKTPTRFTGDSPEVRAALEWIYDMVHERKAMPVPDSLEGNMALNLVVNQNIATSIGNSIRLQQAISLGQDVPWDVAPLPSGPHGNTSVINAIGWAIFDAAGDHDEAWEVIKYFSSEKAMQMSVEMRGTLVPHLGVAREVWLPEFDIPANRQVFIEAVSNSRSLPVLTDQAWTATYRYPRHYWYGWMPLNQAMETIRVGVETWIDNTFDH